MSWRCQCRNHHLLLLLLLRLRPHPSLLRPVPPLLEGAPAAPMASLLPLLLLLLFAAASHALSDAQLLLTFRSSLRNDTALAASWKDGQAPCSGEAANWVGVICQDGAVWGLQLESMGLFGTIDVDALSQIPSLRSLSFMGNNFDGPMLDLTKLGSLKSLFLSRNQFSGNIPADAFGGTKMLKKIELQHNRFTGTIPASLAALPNLVVLRLDGNQFVGRIPDFKQKTLQEFNVSNNALEGPVPPGLATISSASASFSGNKGLCGEPLEACKSEADGKVSSMISKKLDMWMIVVISVVGTLALLGILAAVVLAMRKKQQPPHSEEAPPSNLGRKAAGLKEAEQGSPNSSTPSGGAKLSFVRDDRDKFDLTDLLKASAEILGSGCFGLSYKAALSTGPVMVVKRFKQMNSVGREEFQEHMRRLGRLNHTNLLPLVAYYYRKEEKLLVWDFVSKGSLAQHLHDYKSLGQASLDWATRLKIIKGVARGLSYLYKELPSLVAPHGHLKSSNVLLSDLYEPLLTDYGFIPVMNQENAHELLVAYKSPEYLKHSRITKKTDIWALGILILEILTGHLPSNVLHKGRKNEEEDLPAWVRTMVGEEGVFDKEMGGVANSSGETVKLLKLGLACCEADVDKRPDLREAVDRIEELQEKDNDEDFYSSAASNMGSRGMSLEQINL